MNYQVIRCVRHSHTKPFLFLIFSWVIQRFYTFPTSSKAWCILNSMLLRILKFSFQIYESYSDNLCRTVPLGIHKKRHSISCHNEVLWVSGTWRHLSATCARLGYSRSSPSALVCDIGAGGSGRGLCELVCWLWDSLFEIFCSKDTVHSNIWYSFFTK